MLMTIVEIRLRNTKGERGGTGRRARLRTLCPFGRGGSTPLARSFLLVGVL